MRKTTVTLQSLSINKVSFTRFYYFFEICIWVLPESNMILSK